MVGTPKARIRRTEQRWLDLPWPKVRESVEVKLFTEDGELFVLAKSEGRRAKEQAMRRRKLVRFCGLSGQCDAACPAGTS